MSTPVNSGTNEEKLRPNFEDVCFGTFCDHAIVSVGFGTSDSFLKFLHQVARAQTLTHFLFHLSSKVL